ADAVIGGIKKTATLGQSQLFYFWFSLQPASGTGYDRNIVMNGPGNIFESRFRFAELNGSINAVSIQGIQLLPVIYIYLASNRMAPVFRNFGNDFTHFAIAKN